MALKSRAQSNHDKYFPFDVGYHILDAHGPVDGIKKSENVCSII